MHIKRLELRGFKSFADKTELHLANGMTAVVGPNGSGKSNLADAIKWVLGEQSVKALRGARMDELIFSGTKTRRGLGLAEVSLVFDNESGRFPIAFNEVAVTRRIFKSGESEYYLNQAKCRLRDIQDLFLDTGIGKDAYSFIGQGRIDELLSARPEDRRAIFEEVAGIAKYKARKRETENKLRDAEAALTRIHDLLHELENEREPLEAEALRAKEYLRLEAELNGVERELLLYELNMAERRLERDNRQRHDLQDQSQQRQAQLLQSEAEEESLRLQLATMQEDLEASNQRLLAAVRQQEQLASKKQVLASRCADKQAQVDLLQAKEAELASSSRIFAEAEQTGSAALAEIRKASKEAEESLKTCQDQLQSLAVNSADEELIQAEVKLQQVTKTQNAAVLNAKLWQDRMARLQSQHAAEHKQLIELEERYQQLQVSVSQVAAERAALEAKVQHLHEVVTASREERGQVAQVLTESEKTQRHLMQELAVRQSRFSLLREVVDGLEGYQRGVRGLLQAKNQGQASLQGIVGVVGDLLHVDAKYEVAVEAALGGSIQFLLAETEADAEKAIEWLKSHQMGRATFLPLDVVRPRQLRPLELEAARQAGAIGFAVDLVQYDLHLANAMGHLLGHILFVETMPQAIAIARRTKHQVRIVTLEGDVLMPGGSLSGGSRQRQGSSLLGRSRELASLAEAQANLEKQLAKLKADVGQCKAKVEQQQHVCQQQEAKLIQEQAALQKLVAREVALTQTMVDQKKQLAEYVLKEQNTKAQLATCIRSQEQAEEELNAANVAWQAQEQLLLELRSKAAGHLHERQVLEGQIHQAEITLVSLREQEASRQRELVTARQRLAETRVAVQDIASERLGLVEQLASDSALLENLQQEIATQTQVVTDSQDQLAELKARMVAANQHLLGNRELVRKAREELESVNKQLYNLELRLSRLEADCDGMVKRLEREFAIADRAGLHSTLQSRIQGEERQGKLQEELLLLGPVRVGALQELERLSERIAFLRSQEADVLTSRQSLEDIITEIDQIMAKRFSESFAQIRRAFIRVFQELFGGGEAELRLSDAEQPLESGIEIMAQPPGKNLQNIDLLSGGEKALTAIALLCATLEVKPTPFCLLDEIDASLDDINTKRLMQVIARLAQDTQFILITHSKETMLAVDTLYGVTMPEHGVSQLINVELSDIES